MDIGVVLIAAVGFFFVLAVCLIILVLVLRAKENTDALKAELQAIRKELDRLTSGAR